MAEEQLTVGVPSETYPGETRVAATPLAVSRVDALGLRLVLESGAGERAGFPDEEYERHGARIVGRAEAIGADIVLQVRTYPANHELGREDLPFHRADQIVIGLADPFGARREVGELAERGVTLFAMELVPRIARAQSMDVLSSQATAAGYKAIILVADRLPTLMPMLTTAAGTFPPARVLVIGAGVVGLQAIATARRLGAMVEAYDVRPAAQEDVESLGARLVALPLAPGDAEDASGYAKALGDAFYRRQQEHLAGVVSDVDAVVCSAVIPGGPAPILLTDEAIAGMRPGSVVVDLAAPNGGNCALTQPDRTVVAHGVTILGPTNLAASVPQQASLMFSKNLTEFLAVLIRDGVYAPDPADPVVAATLVTEGGTIVLAKLLPRLEEAAP
ncbi:MAG: NAD(P) transhydrogenase subunit alpha [Actinomycetota bacterium]